MSERDRATKTWRLRLAGFIDAMNQRVGVCAIWLILVMTLISAANAVSLKALSVNSNVFPETQWYLFAALFLLAAGCALQRNQTMRVGNEQGVNPYRPMGIMTATLTPAQEKTVALKTAHEIYENECATEPMLRRVYQSWEDFRYTQVQRYRIAEASFSNFMASQRLPFR